MSPRSSLAALAFLLLLGAGCSYSTHMYAAPAKAALDGRPGQIDHLARGFLVPSYALEPKGHAFYAYLLFADRAASTLEQRKAVAAEFLSSFEDVSEVSGMGIDAGRMALLLAPVKTTEDARALVHHSDVERFLTAYDYAYASVLHDRLVSRLGRPLPRVLLIGAPQPLQPSSPIDVEGLRMTDLCGPADKVSAKLFAFRQGLLMSSSESTAVALLEKLRLVFRSLGELAIIGNAVAAEKPVPEGCY